MSEKHGGFERGVNGEDNEQSLKFEGKLSLSAKHVIFATEPSRVQVARTSCETPKTKFLKNLSKCFLRLEVPPARKLRRESRKFFV